MSYFIFGLLELEPDAGDEWREGYPALSAEHELFLRTGSDMPQPELREVIGAEHGCDTLEFLLVKNPSEDTSDEAIEPSMGADEQWREAAVRSIARLGPFLEGLRALPAVRGCQFYISHGTDASYPAWPGDLDGLVQEISSEVLGYGTLPSLRFDL